MKRHKQLPRAVILGASCAHPRKNDFRDLVAITGTLSADMTKEDYVAALEKSEDLYELAPSPLPSDDAPRKLASA
jgi:hypothetical protein